MKMYLCVEDVVFNPIQKEFMLRQRILRKEFTNEQVDEMIKMLEERNDERQQE